MLPQAKILRASIATVSLACGAGLLHSPWAKADKVNVDGKVVLANVDKHSVTFRIGTTRKDVAPRKASALAPKKYPLRIEVWSGSRTNARWIERQISGAGIYLLRYQNGQWNLAKHTPRKTVSTSPAPSAPSALKPAYRRPSYRRATGTAPRVVRGSGRVYRGPRFPLLCRVTGDVLALYRFIRDEDDRDLLRDIIIGREIDRELELELWDRLDDMAVNLPASDRLEFERALRDLQSLSERDWKDLDEATKEEWDSARDELGDEVTDSAWREVESDFSDLDIETQPVDETLEDVGIDSLDSNIDLDDLEGADVGAGDLATSLDDFDVEDLGGGIEDIDVGDLGSDFGAGVDPGFSGGGFNYDQGGFDDFGGNMGGGDWGGSEYGGGDFGGGDLGGGGDFGGGDLGGGFDDFGGGGFDDFGGGFDDF